MRNNRKEMKYLLPLVLCVLPFVANADIASKEYVDEVAGKITTALQNKADDNKVMHLSGGEMTNNATIKFSAYGNRFVTISGNSIVADMSKTTGGWAGSFASVKDPVGNDTTMLGWYGDPGGLNYIYMGGTYSSPGMKMTKGGEFTFAKPVAVGNPTEDTTTSVQADTVGARNAKINSITSKIKDNTNNTLVNIWIE